MLGTTELEQLSFLPNLSITEIGQTAGSNSKGLQSQHLGEQSHGQVDSLLKASLVYRVNSRPVRDTQQDLVSEEKRKKKRKSRIGDSSAMKSTHIVALQYL